MDSYTLHLEPSMVSSTKCLFLKWYDNDCEIPKLERPRKYYWEGSTKVNQGTVLNKLGNLTHPQPWLLRIELAKDRLMRLPKNRARRRSTTKN